MSRGVGFRCSLDLVLLWLWWRLAVITPSGPLAWELPYDAGAALKSKTNKQTNKQKELGGCVGHTLTPPVPPLALLVPARFPNPFDLRLLQGYEVLAAFFQERMRLCKGIQKTNLPPHCTAVGSAVGLNKLPDTPGLSFLLCKMGLIIPVFSTHSHPDTSMR